MPKNLIDIDEQVIEFKDLQKPKETVVTLDYAVKFPGTEEYAAFVEPAPTALVVPTRLELLQACPRCSKPLVPAMAVSGNESVSFKECPECGTLINTFKPTSYQARYLRRMERYKMTAGGFGCSPVGSKVLMYDFSLKNVEDIVVGDLLMGIDGTPRIVLELHRGIEQMYRVDITNNKVAVSSFEVTGNHMLYLTPRGQYTRKNKVIYTSQPTINLSVKDYIKCTDRFKGMSYLSYMPAMEFDEKQLPLHPYLVGVLLGDGMLGYNGCIKVTASDPEIVSALNDYAPNGTEIRKGNYKKGSNTYDYRFCDYIRPTKSSKGAMRTVLEMLGLYQKDCYDKFIPKDYLLGSKKQRLELLAGLIDTDGCKHGDSFRIYTVSKALATDIKLLGYSLGIPVSITRRPTKNIYVLNLCGANVTYIPVRIPRKKINPEGYKNPYLRRFTVTPTDIKPFYGFTLDKDQLYIDGDSFIIQHNSGKSRSNVEDVIKHLLLIPNARVCVAARTYPALEGTFVKEFYSMFPAKLVRRKNDQKHEISLTNGSEILFRSFDDETKLKSMNLTMAVIVEASDVNYNAFTMLQSRIRNTAAMLPELDANGEPVMEYDASQHSYRPKHRVDVRHINLETNPDSGWVKSRFLLDSHLVEFFGDAYNEAYRYNPNPDPHKYTQIVSTSANPYLPEGYEEEQTRGKSKAYILQFYKGSFNFSSNLVFPNFGACIVPPHPLPRAFNEDGRRVLFFVIGADYGINDPTHFVFSAFSLETKKLYVFAEYRLNNSDIKTIAKGYRKELRTNGTDLDGLLMCPKFDGKSYNKRESNLVSIGGMFEAEGLFFEPAFASHESRIIKLNSLVNHNQIEIYSTCEFLIEEALNYKFKIDRKGEPTSQPQDGHDHGITALEFSIVDLPHNLTELRLNAYLPPGTKVIHDKLGNDIIKKEKQAYDPLAEDESNAKRNVSNFNSRVVVSNDPSVDNRSRSFDRVFGDDQQTDDEDYEQRPLQAYIPGR